MRKPRLRGVKWCRSGRQNNGFVPISVTCAYLTLHGKGLRRCDLGYGPWDGEIILDYPSGFEVIVWVPKSREPSQAWSERDVTWERRESRNAGGLKQLGKARTRTLLQRHWQRIQPYQYLDFNPHPCWTSDPQHFKIINLYCFKTLSLWQFATEQETNLGFGIWSLSRGTESLGWVFWIDSGFSGSVL